VTRQPPPGTPQFTPDSHPVRPVASGNPTFFASVLAALNGIRVGLATQRNLRIHAILVLVVTTAGFTVGLSPAEWLSVTLVMGLVLTAELLNTAVEAVVDLVQPEYDELAGQAKDLAAGAVLVASLTALVAGLLIFGPHLIKLSTEHFPAR
jgi:diacylglycerol kinase